MTCFIVNFYKLNNLVICWLRSSHIFTLNLSSLRNGLGKNDLFLKGLHNCTWPCLQIYGHSVRYSPISAKFGYLAPKEKKKKFRNSEWLRNQSSYLISHKYIRPLGATPLSLSRVFISYLLKHHKYLDCHSLFISFICHLLPNYLLVSKC